MDQNTDKRFQHFREFYPFYLREHQRPLTKLFHCFGTTSSLLFLLIAWQQGNAWWILAGLAWGYFWAWTSHFFVEKNRPATFQYPLYSFMGDWVMLWECLQRKHRLY